MTTNKDGRKNNGGKRDNAGRPPVKEKKTEVMKVTAKEKELILSMRKAP